MMVVFSTVTEEKMKGRAWQGNNHKLSLEHVDLMLTAEDPQRKTGRDFTLNERIQVQSKQVDL